MNTSAAHPLYKFAFHLFQNKARFQATNFMASCRISSNKDVLADAHSLTLLKLRDTDQCRKQLQPLQFLSKLLFGPICSQGCVSMSVLSCNDNKGYASP